MNNSKLTAFNIAQLCEANPNPDRSYLSEKHRIEQLYENLKDRLSDKDLRILHKLIKSENKIIAMESSRSFIKGLDLGTSLALEAWN